MANDQQYTLVRKCYDQVINQGNIEAIDDYFSPDFVDHGELPPGIPKNREGLKRYFTMMRKAFRDLHYEVEDEIVQADKIVLRMHAEGSQQGEFLGTPPTGKRVKFPLIGIYRIADGKIAEHWGVADQLKAFEQLGILHPPGPPRQ